MANRKNPITAVFSVNRIRKKRAVHDGHVRVQGGVSAELLVVGGNLEIAGDLDVGQLVCFGEVRVVGNARIGSGTLRRGLYVGGDLNGGSLRTDREMDVVQAEAESHDLDPDAVLHDALVDVAFDSNSGEYASGVECSGELTLDSLTATGDVTVKRQFWVDFADICGELSAGNIVIEEDCWIGSGMWSRHHVASNGDLYAGSITCHGNLEAWNVEVALDIDVNGYIDAEMLTTHEGTIRAGGAIRVSGISSACTVSAGGFIAAYDSIKVGRGYGVAAGLVFAKADWPAFGYIAAAQCPRRILTGSFISDKAQHDIDDQFSKLIDLSRENDALGY